ncbi:hypothetical protein M0811_13008 [Anaeramoeba ignava]|uniref:Transmembrane protein n=1 Tax=Anaeramoeba ignava TaxID=1746090 RepID=A0A9Q0L776_ANAIG|nr:hypothetical protein M0811_13008 [Anaeramoeba ignava]
MICKIPNFKQFKITSILILIISIFSLIIFTFEKYLQIESKGFSISFSISNPKEIILNLFYQFYTNRIEIYVFGIILLLKFAEIEELFGFKKFLQFIIYISLQNLLNDLIFLLIFPNLNSIQNGPKILFYFLGLQLLIPSFLKSIFPFFSGVVSGFFYRFKIQDFLDGNFSNTFHSLWIKLKNFFSNSNNEIDDNQQEDSDNQREN